MHLITKVSYQLYIGQRKTRNTPDFAYRIQKRALRVSSNASNLLYRYQYSSSQQQQ
jgi:hypothetical protein